MIDTGCDAPMTKILKDEEKIHCFIHLLEGMKGLPGSISSCRIFL